MDGVWDFYCRRSVFLFTLTKVRPHRARSGRRVFCKSRIRQRERRAWITGGHRTAGGSPPWGGLVIDGRPLTFVVDPLSLRLTGASGTGWCALLAVVRWRG